MSSRCALKGEGSSPGGGGEGSGMEEEEGYNHRSRRYLSGECFSVKGEAEEEQMERRLASPHRALRGEGIGVDTIRLRIAATAIVVCFWFPWRCGCDVDEGGKEFMLQV